MCKMRGIEEKFRTLKTNKKYMKIITWNCQGGFRNKFHHILTYPTDILIIQECESPKRINMSIINPTDYYWYGVSENKGIAIFTFSDYTMDISPLFEPTYQYIIPLKIRKEKSSINLFAIWAMNNHTHPSHKYIGQIGLALEHYASLLTQPCLIAGDFNSNAIWDTQNKPINHSTVVQYLQQYQIYSLYHTQESLDHGAEKHPTFYMYRKINKPYHLDYCFASAILLQHGFQLTIADPDFWLQHSDHVPLIAELHTT